MGGWVGRGGGGKSPTQTQQWITSQLKMERTAVTLLGLGTKRGWVLPAAVNGITLSIADSSNIASATSNSRFTKLRASRLRASSCPGVAV